MGSVYVFARQAVQEAYVALAHGSLPLFRFLKKRAPKLPGCAGCEIAWNYEKFLLDGAGVPVARYPATTSPMAAEETIVKLLGAG